MNQRPSGYEPVAIAGVITKHHTAARHIRYLPCPVTSRTRPRASIQARLRWTAARLAPVSASPIGAETGGHPVRAARKDGGVLPESGIISASARAGCASLARTGDIIQRSSPASAQSPAVLHRRRSAFGRPCSGGRAAPSEAASAVRIPGGFQARAASPASPSCSGSGRSRKLSIPKAARNASVVTKV